METIIITYEALFDLLQERGGFFYGRFRNEYKEYEIQIDDEKPRIIEPDYENPMVEEIYKIYITKEGAMRLMLNKVFTCKEYTLIIEN